jgi:hypothetical protein
MSSVGTVKGNITHMWERKRTTASRAHAAQPLTGNSREPRGVRTN